MFCPSTQSQRQESARPRYPMRARPKVQESTRRQLRGPKYNSRQAGKLPGTPSLCGSPSPSGRYPRMRLCKGERLGSEVISLQRAWLGVR